MCAKIKFNRLNIPLAAQINVNDQKYLYFGGTAYLGIPQNENFLEHYLVGIKKFGLNNGTSRSNNVQLGIYDEAERCASERFKTEAALITSSGYLAAQLTIKKVSTMGEVRYAPATHPALWQNGAPQVDGSFENWTSQIVAEINASTQKNWVLISNAMNNLYPEIYDFSFIKNFNQDKNIVLVVDDSHGIGINHKGSSANFAIPKQQNVSILVVASMAKALGVDAGIVLGPATLINELKQTHEFLGASPPSAAGLYAFMQSEKIYQQEHQKLKNNMLLMEEALANRKEWHFIRGFPVYFSKNADLSEKLLTENILISSFPYPDKDGEMVNRIVLSSWHSEKEIKKLITFV